MIKDLVEIAEETEDFILFDANAMSTSDLLSEVFHATGFENIDIGDVRRARDELSRFLEFSDCNRGLTVKGVGIEFKRYHGKISENSRYYNRHKKSKERGHRVSSQHEFEAEDIWGELSRLTVDVRRAITRSIKRHNKLNPPDEEYNRIFSALIYLSDTIPVVTDGIYELKVPYHNNWNRPYLYRENEDTRADEALIARLLRWIKREDCLSIRTPITLATRDGDLPRIFYVAVRVFDKLGFFGSGDSRSLYGMLERNVVPFTFMFYHIKQREYFPHSILSIGEESEGAFRYLGESGRRSLLKGVEMRLDGSFK